MIRKLALAALVAAGTLGGLNATAAAEPPIPLDRRDRDHDRDRGVYRVLVRHRGHWDVRGTYRDRDDAQRAARRLERRGYDAKVERIRGW